MRALVERLSPGWLWAWIAFYGCSLSILSAYLASAAAASLLNIFHDAN